MNSNNSETRGDNPESEAKEILQGKKSAGKKWKKWVCILAGLCLFIGIGGLSAVAVKKVLAHVHLLEAQILQVNQSLDEVNERLKITGGTADLTDLPLLDVDTASYVDSDTVVLRMELEDVDSKLYIHRGPESSPYEVASSAFIDFANKKIGLLEDHKPGDLDVKTAAEQDIDFEIVQGHRYSIYYAKEDDNLLRLTLLDEYTGEQVCLEGSTAESGIGWGLRSWELEHGNVNVFEFYNLSTQPSKVRTAIVGDSFIEGNQLKNDRPSRYASLIKEELGGNAFICGKGSSTSADGLDWLNQYLLDVVEPEYMILAFGMNDTDFDVWKANVEEMCALLKQKKICPVLVTITPTASTKFDNDVHMKMNDYIRESGYLYIDAAKACSLNQDGITFDADLFMEDQVHPTVEGHEKIYEEALVDVPEMFK